jgi:hypothetical protein
MRTLLIGAEAATIAFGPVSICGRLEYDWTSDEPIIEFSCLPMRRLHAYQLNIGASDRACCCSPSDE